MPRERYPRPGKGQNLRGLSLLARQGLREKEGRKESGTGGGIGPGRGRSALPRSGRKGRNEAHTCGAVGGVAGTWGRPFLIASIFSVMEEARSSCAGVAGSFPGWETEDAGGGWEGPGRG